MRRFHRKTGAEKAKFQAHFWIQVLLEVHCSQFIMSAPRAEKRQKGSFGAITGFEHV